MKKFVKPSSWSSAFDLVYDAWNRLIQVKDGATTVATYGYDGFNRRVRKVVGSETRLFYFNRGWQCVEEHVGSTCDARYVWGLRYIDDLVTYRKGSTDYYSLADANWNVVALTNTAGAVQERYTYSAFGKVNFFDAAFATRATSACSVTRTFTGQVLDNETGLMLYRHRVYHPTLGRFVQRDPIGYRAMDANLYRYVFNSPLDNTDLHGLEVHCSPWSQPTTVTTLDVYPASLAKVGVSLSGLPMDGELSFEFICQEVVTKTRTRWCFRSCLRLWINRWDEVETTITHTSWTTPEDANKKHPKLKYSTGAFIVSGTPSIGRPIGISIESPNVIYPHPSNIASAQGICNVFKSGTPVTIPPKITSHNVQWR